MQNFKIANRQIGPQYAPVIIAEIGINHEGSIDVAIQMADCAIEHGAEIIKHQTHIVSDEMSIEAKLVIPGNADVSIYEIMARCSLSEADEYKLMQHVTANGCIFLSTPFSRAAANRLIDFGVPAFKVGSGECNNYPFINYLAKFGLPMIVSTGMNDIEGIRPTVDIMRRAKVPFALLHCTNIYPTPPELVRLDAMVQLGEEFPDAVIGLSDHSITNYPSLGAVALGASIIERHFTDSYTRPGPDITCSMDGPALQQLIEGSECIFSSKFGRKTAVIEEGPTIAFAFASVAITARISKSELFSEENIFPMRPAGGDYAVADYPSLLGKRASRDLEPGRQLRFEDVES